MRADHRYARRRTGVVIAVLSVLLALLIPVCALLARDYYLEAVGRQSSEPVSAPSPSSSQPEEDAESEAPETSSEAEEEEPAGGPVPESDPAGQEYFDNAVFFGDSITAGISVYSLMSNAEVVAVTGANPDSALNKANFTPSGGEERVTMTDALKALEPGKIYIQLGANWVGERSGIDEKTFINHYRLLLERIREDHPEAVIYIQSMFPVSKEYDTNANGKNTYGLTDELIRTYNEALADLAQEMGLWYLDLYDVFSDEEGYLPADYTTDGMHITPQYYEKWFDYLKSHTVPAPGDAAASSDEPEDAAASLDESDDAASLSGSDDASASQSPELQAEE